MQKNPQIFACGIRNEGKFCFEIQPAQLKEYRFRNPEFLFHWQRILNLAGIHGVESIIQEYFRFPGMEWQKHQVCCMKKREFIFDEINSKAAYLCFIFAPQVCRKLLLFQGDIKGLNQAGAPNENIVQNRLNTALLNVFYSLFCYYFLNVSLAQALTIRSISID